MTEYVTGVDLVEHMLNVAAGRPFPAMALAIAGWVRFMAGTDERGAPIEGIKDPRASELRVRAAAVVEVPATASVRSFLAEFFGTEVAESAAAVDAVAAAVTSVASRGAGASLAAVLTPPQAKL